MTRSCSLPILLAGISMALAFSAVSLAQTTRTETVPASAATAGSILQGSLTGEESVDYLIAADAGQRLSVDVSSNTASLSFNILPQGSDEALFIGSTSGNVADLPIPAAGTYVVRVYLMRNAARRAETADYALGIGLAGGDFADGLAGGPDWWAVSGISAGALNIRSGPDTRYAVVGHAQNAEVLQNRGCRMTGPARWCSIRVDGSGVQGWVDGRFLVETAAPVVPAASEGGPVGNGLPFDATGMVDCAVATGEAMRRCAFGVVRSGPGNAGVCIALGNGEERQILFEGGAPVAANTGAALTFRKSGDQFSISIGDERYAFPEALVNGG